jgi:phage shock protein E
MNPRNPVLVVSALTVVLASTTHVHAATPIPNSAIDMRGYLRVASDAAAWRDSHRISAEQFETFKEEPGTIVLDARSAQKFEELHVKGAINLSFPDITADTLRQVIPDKRSRVLIYCNNNFLNAPRAFPSKKPTASLNLSTFIALYNYGYRNVYELGPLLDVNSTKLSLVSD